MTNKVRAAVSPANAPNISARKPTARTLSSLEILSWNIHDRNSSSTGPKKCDPIFKKLTERHLILALQETKGEVYIPNFRCFNKLRKGSRSGGTCIAIHKSLADGCEELSTGSEDILAVRISVKNENLIIVNVYDSPENSSFKLKKITAEDYFNPTTDQILDFLSSPTVEGKLVVVGDFNARTGSLGNLPDDEDKKSFDPNQTSRASRDSIINERGRKLLELFDSVNLSILNGTTLGDLLGEYTCFTYNGASVVDYVAASQELVGDIISLEMGELNPLSDHRPLTVTLGIKSSFTDPDELTSALDDAPKKYKWDANSPSTSESFHTYLANHKDVESARNFNCSSQEDVRALNDKVTGLFSDAAEAVLKKPKTISNKKRKGNRMKPLHPWFDAECIRGKQTLRQLAKRYGQNANCPATRNEYYCHTKSYRKILKSKKRNFFQELSEDVAVGKNVNWSRFKKLKSFSQKDSTLDVFDMRNFIDFFRSLYSKETMSDEKKAKFQAAMQPPCSTSQAEEDLQTILDKTITLEELKKSVKDLKNGKAVAQDLIANEFIKCAPDTLLDAILNVFNSAIRHGVYPWTSSLVTPLHKKGSVYDPNNYRAIAVASNMGKLFANILL